MIYERIRTLCKEKGYTITGMEKDLGFSKGSLSKIDKSNPSQDRVLKIANYLGVSPESIMTGKNADGEDYYIDDEARELAQFLFENPEYRILFDASRTVRKEDIQYVAELLDRINKFRD